MKGFALYTADCAGVETNCYYPHKMTVTDSKTLMEAAVHDYVCVDYKNKYRSKTNFISSNCLGMDCDNEHSDDPEDWITPDSIRSTFPDVTFAVHYSRHNNVSKRGKAPRPKFHCLFQIDDMTDPVPYSDLKKRIHGIFPYFDTQALDAARFFFATAQPDVEFFPGILTLNECLDSYYPDSEEDPDSTPLDEPYTAYTQTIPEGSRNATLSHFAGRVLKRYGDTDEAYAAFLQRASQCDPPLDDVELKTIWRSAQGFFQRISKQEGYVTPDTYNAAAEGAYLYKPDDNSDVGEARMLAKVFSDRLRYSPATDFINFTGLVWEESVPMAHAVMHDLSDMQLEEASQATAAAWKVLEENGAAEIIKSTPNKKKAIAMLDGKQADAYEVYAEAAAYASLAMHYRESKNIRYVLNEVPSMVLIHPQDMDSDPFLLNTPAGTFDLRDGNMRPHNSEDFITKITTLSPGDKGAAIWKDTLATFFQGDGELIRYVQLVAGMVAVGKVFVEAMIIAYGDGRNGKSTFWNVLARVLGTYSGNMSADALTVGCRRNIKPEMAEAKGKRLLIASELEEGTRLNTSTVKQMCSTDEIHAEKKYKAPFKYIPSHTLVLYTNHLPKVGALDSGIWRRLIVIPFNAKIEDKSDIKNYADYLFSNAGEAILAWVIEGAQRVIEMGFVIPLPACVCKAISDYRDENNWLGHFMDECCVIGSDYEAKSGELYSAYRVFCVETGDYIRSTTDFYSALESEGFIKRKTRVGAFIYGLRLTDLLEDDFLR